MSTELTEQKVVEEKGGSLELGPGIFPVIPQVLLLRYVIRSYTHSPSLSLVSLMYHRGIRASCRAQAHQRKAQLPVSPQSVCQNYSFRHFLALLLFLHHFLQFVVVISILLHAFFSPNILWISPLLIASLSSS